MYSGVVTGNVLNASNYTNVLWFGHEKIGVMTTASWCTELIQVYNTTPHTH